MKEKRPLREGSILRRREQAARRLPDPRQILRGTLVERYRKCGRASCHCARQGDQGHGPAYYLMVTVRSGKTETIYIPKERRRAVEAWVRNFQSMRERMEEISSLNRDLLKIGALFEEG